MTQRDDNTQQDQESEAQSSSRAAGDDRRRQVNPADNPRPRNPEVEDEALRAGEEKLDRVKPH